MADKTTKRRNAGGIQEQITNMVAPYFFEADTYLLREDLLEMLHFYCFHKGDLPVGWEDTGDRLTVLFDILRSVNELKYNRAPDSMAGAHASP